MMWYSLLSIPSYSTLTRNFQFLNVSKSLVINEHFNDFSTIIIDVFKNIYVFIVVLSMKIKMVFKGIINRIFKQSLVRERRPTRVNACKTIARPTLVYGYEAWGNR